MARTAKVKFDTNNVFLEGAVEQRARDVFLRSPLFPIFASAYNTVQSKLRVASVDYSTNDAGIASSWVANLTTPEGFSVGMLKGIQSSDPSNSTYSFYTTNGPVNTGGSLSLHLTTNNPRYLATKISAKSNHNAAAYLKASVRDAGEFISRLIYSTVDKAVDTYNGESINRAPSVIVSAAITTFLAKVALGKVAFTDMPINLRVEFDQQFNHYKQAAEKFESAIASTKDYIKGGKWVYIPDIHKGVIVAAIDSGNAERALDLYASGELLPDVDRDDLLYAQYLVNPKWYPSHDEIPEEHRRELDYALMVLKVHTADKPVEEPTYSFGSVTQVYLDIGASTHTNAYGAKVYVLQR